MNNPPIQENSITHIWERFNPSWMIVGLVSGLTSGFIVMLTASILSAYYLGEWSYGLKLVGSMFTGSHGLAFGAFNSAAFLGALVHFGLSAIFGLSFAQLVNEHSLPSSLIAIAVVLSLIIWVFGNQLFMPSVNPLLRLHMPTLASLGLHVLFGMTFGIAISVFRSSLLR